MTSPTSSITLSADGQSITITNCDVTFNSGFDPSTGVATMTVTPKGTSAAQLVSTMPALLQGEPGPYSTIRNVNMTQVPAGQALPQPPASVTPVAPGIYDLNIAVNSGEQGSTGQNVIQSASDLVGTATNNATIIWNALTNQFEYQPQMLGTLYWPSTINTVSGSADEGQPQVLCTITVPARTFAWYPVVLGQAVVNGTVNTQVKLSANIGSTSGQQVAVGYGVTGLLQQLVALQAAIPAGSTGTYGQIASGASATIVISATQIANVTDAWSISPTQASFNMMVNPVPPS